MLLFKKYTELLSFYTLLLIPFIMPIDSKPLGLLIGIFGVFQIAQGIANKSFSIKKKPAFWLGISFFALHLISVLYSENKDRAWFDIEVKLSLLIFPLLFAFKNQFIEKRKIVVFISFIIGCIISAIIMLFDSYELSKSIGKQAFYYSNITKMHSSYISMYFIWSMILQLALALKKKLPLYLNLLVGVSITIHLIMVFLFQSKASILAVGLLLIIFLIASIFTKKKVLAIICATIIACSSVLYLTQSYNRMESMVSEVKVAKTTGKHNEEGSTGIRILIWKITVSEIQKHPIIGVGNGDILHTLIKRYDEEKLHVAKQQKLNTHSQYLETFLGLGFIGFSSLILLLGYGLYFSYKQNDWLRINFMLLVGFCFLPESMLNLRPGIVFFCFFYFLLFQFIDIKKRGLKKAPF